MSKVSDEDLAFYEEPVELAVETPADVVLHQRYEQDEVPDVQLLAEGM